MSWILLERVMSKLQDLILAVNNNFCVISDFVKFLILTLN